ncbi:acyl-CoA N-acyltransferase [Cladorrhinum sp. PSN259]|nr:acyl-CoA N-acyltransferase [Cladorrhinum sp. PSN259]
MVHLILPALIPDVKEVYKTYFAAFHNDPMGKIMLQMLFPGVNTDSEEFRGEHAKGTLSWWHQSDTQYTYKCVDTDNGAIIGMGLMDIFLRRRSPEERVNHGVTWLEGEQRKRAEAVLNPLFEMREKLFGDQPYIYVHVVGVLPEHQGKQAGRALLNWGLEFCDYTNLPIYFEASPTTVGLYERLGYERLKEKIVHKAEVLGTETDIEVPLMVRMPRSAGGMKFEEWKEKGFPSFNAPTAAKK